MIIHNGQSAWGSLLLTVPAKHWDNMEKLCLASCVLLCCFMRSVYAGMSTFYNNDHLAEDSVLVYLRKRAETDAALSNRLHRTSGETKETRTQC